VIFSCLHCTVLNAESVFLLYLQERWLHAQSTFKVCLDTHLYSYNRLNTVIAYLCIVGFPCSYFRTFLYSAFSTIATLLCHIFILHGFLSHIFSIGIRLFVSVMSPGLETWCLGLSLLGCCLGLILALGPVTAICCLVMTFLLLTVQYFLCLFLQEDDLELTYFLLSPDNKVFLSLHVILCILCFCVWNIFWY